MRMFKPLVFLLSFALIAPPQASAVVVPTEFAITGAGYGHGVGLSQIGARSKALAGETATAILNYYYKDVVIQPLDDSKILRVNVGHLLSTARIATSTPDATLQIFSGDIGDAQDVAPLAIVPVNKTTLPPFEAASCKLALTFVFTSAHVASLPAILGCFKRKLS